MSLKYAQTQITAPKRLEKHTSPPDHNFLSSQERCHGYEPSHAASSVVNSRSAHVKTGFFLCEGERGESGEADDGLVSLQIYEDESRGGEKKRVGIKGVQRWEEMVGSLGAV